MVIVDPNDQNVIAAILKTIRTKESGNNYLIQTPNPKSDASGAYQFTSPTWNNFGGYKHAKDAPPEIQDEKAKQHVLGILKRHSNDVRWVPAVWYVGDRGASTINWDSVPRYNRSTINQYVNSWLAVFQKILASSPNHFLIREQKPNV